MTILNAPRRPARPAGGFILQNVPWRTYEDLVRDLEEQHVCLTYDRGSLEIMPPPSADHEHMSRFLERLVHVYTEEHGIPIRSLGSTTWRNEEVGGGLEADCCYYIGRSESAVRGLKKISLDRVPPPDLAIEIDVTRSTLNKRGVYARLGIPELWRCERGRVIVEVLSTASGDYESAAQSRCLPNLTLAEVQRFTDLLKAGVEETDAVRQFRAWVKSRAAGAAPDAPKKPTPRRRRKR